MNPLQQKAYDAVSAALPFAVDPAKITVEPGLSYLPSPIKLHDYAVGAMAAFGSVVEHPCALRGLPAQTMKLNRRLCGFHLNELQVQFLNGYSVPQARSFRNMPAWWNLIRWRRMKPPFPSGFWSSHSARQPASCSEKSATSSFPIKRCLQTATNIFSLIST